MSKISIVPNSSEVGEGVFIVWVEIQPLPLATSAFCRGSRCAGRPTGQAGARSGETGFLAGQAGAHRGFHRVGARLVLLWPGGARLLVRYRPGRPVSHPAYRASHRRIPQAVTGQVLLCPGCARHVVRYRPGSPARHPAGRARNRTCRCHIRSCRLRRQPAH